MLLPLLSAFAAAVPAEHTCCPEPSADGHEIELTRAVDGSVHVDVVYDGEWLSLALEPAAVRTSDFRFEVTGADGTRRGVQAPAPSLFRGTVAGLPGSDVAASVVGDEVHGLLFLPDGRGYHYLEPVDDGDPTTALHRVTNRRQNPLQGLQCGQVRPALDPAPLLSGSGGAPLVPHSGSVLEIEVACDADVEYFDLFGGLAATVADIERLIGLASLVYERDLGVVLTVPYIHVWTSEPDPYPATGPLLNDFKDHWNANFGGVTRDVAHLFSGKPVGPNGLGGKAFIASGCDLDRAYSWSKPFPSSTLAYRMAIVAHELGHNFGATHCDSAPDCNIMCSSFSCDLTSAGMKYFEAPSIAAISSYISTVSCVGSGTASPAPAVAGLFPNQDVLLAPDKVTVTGTGFYSALELSFDGQVFDIYGSTVQVLSDTKIEFQVPWGSAIGPVDLIVSGPGGASAPATYTFNEVDPPRLLAVECMAGGFPYNWDFGGPVGDFGVLSMALDPSMTPTNPPLLANGFSVWSGTLADPGLGQYVRIVPAGWIGQTFYSQFVTTSPAGVVQATDVIGSYVYDWVTGLCP